MNKLLIGILASAGGASPPPPPPPPPPSTSYANLGGQGLRQAPITWTTNAVSGSQDASYLLDGVHGNVYYINGGQTGREWRWDFGQSVLIDEATWYQDSINSQGTWKFQGSSDDITYIDIGGTFNLGASATDVLTSLNGNTSAYRYYKLLQTAGVTSSGPYLQEIEFKIDAHTTGYLNPTYGMGDRSANITVSSTGGLCAGGGANEQQWVKDSFTQANYFNSLSSASLTFDLGTAHKINEAFFTMLTTPTAQGTWQWAGSNDDITYVSIGSTFAIGAVAHQRLTTLNGNTTAYRYYRMTLTSGNSNNTPYIGGFQFSIG